MIMLQKGLRTATRIIVLFLNTFLFTLPETPTILIHPYFIRKRDFNTERWALIRRSLFELLWSVDRRKKLKVAHIQVKKKLKAKNRNGENLKHLVSKKKQSFFSFDFF